MTYKSLYAVKLNQPTNQPTNQSNGVLILNKQEGKQGKLIYTSRNIYVIYKQEILTRIHKYFSKDKTGIYCSMNKKHTKKGYRDGKNFP